MGWFNVVKGGYPTIDMPVADHPIEDSAAGRAIVRGSIMTLASNTWRVTTNSSDRANKSLFYFALQPATDLSAAMAGSIALPRLVGMPCNNPLEVETDQYDATGTYAIDTLLMAGDSGKVVNVTLGSGYTVVGIVTQVPTARWVNDATAVSGYRTGNNVSVIRFRLLFAPAIT